MRQILCFGDSNTYGYVPGTGKRYPWGVRWTSILNEMLGMQKYRVIEEGLCGRTTVYEDVTRRNRDGSKVLPVVLESQGDCDLVIIMLGTNDCKTSYRASAEEIGEGMRKLIRQVRTYSGSSEILIMAPIHLGDGVWKKGYDTEFGEKSLGVSWRLGEVYRNVAKQEGVFFLNAADYAQPSAVDREHLDPEGHRRLAEAVYESLRNWGFVSDI